MRLVLVCPVYPPEVMPSGVMLDQLAKHFVSVGHEVTVYTTFPSLPEGRVFPGYQRHLWKTWNRNGVGVTRCFSFVYGPERKSLWRVLSHLSFTLTTMARLLMDAKPDVLIVEVFPVISSPWLVGLAKLLRIATINYIKDMYPEVVEDARMIKRGGAISVLMRWVDRLTCTWTDVNLVLDDSFKEVLIFSRGIRECRIEVIPDWIDGSRIAPTDRENLWREEQRIPLGTFVAMFAGTLGYASGADVLADVARELKSRQYGDIVILCIGEGVLKGPMLEKAKSLNLDNIRFLPFQQEERLSEVQSTADVMLLTMSERHTLSSVPSKLITYLAAGRPVLCSADPASAVAKVVASAGIGLVIQPGDPVALAEALIEMRANQREWAERGQKAREYFEKNFAMPVALEKFDHLVETLVNGNLHATR